LFMEQSSSPARTHKDMILLKSDLNIKSSAVGRDVPFSTNDRSRKLLM
jgi:hypothetical protein